METRRTSIVTSALLISTLLLTAASRPVAATENPVTIRLAAAETPRETTPDGKLSCGPCGMAFSSEKEKAVHEIEHHGKPGCARCGVAFETPQEQARHAIEHHGAKGCMKCGVLFTDKQPTCGCKH